MSSRNSTDWMWAQACALIDEAERMHRQFFRLGVSERTQAVWEPPVDVFEDDSEVVVVVALPGVAGGRGRGHDGGRASWSCAPRRDSPSPAAATSCAGSRFRTAISSGASRCRIRGARGRHARVGERLPRAAAAQIDRRREIMNEHTAAETPPASADASLRRDEVADGAQPARPGRCRARCPTTR